MSLKIDYLFQYYKMTGRYFGLFYCGCNNLVFNPFASEAVYTCNFCFDRMSDSV